MASAVSQSSQPTAVFMQARDASAGHLHAPDNMQAKNSNAVKRKDAHDELAEDLLNSQLHLADSMIQKFQNRLMSINHTADALMELLKKVTKATVLLDPDAAHSAVAQENGEEPIPIEKTLRAGEIRNRGMVGMDCMTPLENRRIISYPCLGSVDQTWRWSTDGQLVGYRHSCIDVTDYKFDGSELRTRPCKHGLKGQQWTVSDGGMWLPTSEIRSRLYPDYCITSPLGPYALNDTIKGIHLAKCGVNCNQLWLVNAIAVNQSVPATSFPRVREQPEKRDNSKSGRIFCWVMTNPKNHATKCKTLRDTWGKYCDTLLFATTKSDPELPTVVLDLQGEEEDRQMLWRKSKLMWMHVYHKYLNKAEWFLRADDGKLKQRKIGK